MILAGGRGERLRPFTDDRPKAMVPIAGKPLLAYQIDSLRRCGLTDILLVTGYRGEQIASFFGDGSRLGVRLEYFVEREPLGTAGALVRLRADLPEQILVLYGDLMLDADLSRFVAFHRGHSGSCSIVVHPNGHPADSDVVVLDARDMVRDILRKNVPRSQPYFNRVSAGLVLLDRTALTNLPEDRPLDLESDVLVPAMVAGSLYGYRTPEYIKDMGTHDRLAQVERDVVNGLVERRNLAHPQRAVFLDRDGTINDHVGFLVRPEQLRVRDEVYEALELLNRSDYLAIVVSNQPVIARNLCSIEQLNAIHCRLESMLGERHVYLDDLFYCPHHEHAGFPGENKAYKIVCECRKPKTGMVRDAARRYGIDLSASYLIGDTTVDVQTGKNSGVRTILLSTGEGGRDGKYPARPDAQADDLLQAVTQVLAAAGMRQ
ncbi:HAD-IIIA family hydrolase [Actinoplanes sp. NPDC026619]|uniref:HAD-IIIA family hydrolase n=1 Tax=Actinoplanes sp. NPDC026619 TaxID=3155798 RepID=UPI0034113050